MENIYQKRYKDIINKYNFKYTGVIDSIQIHNIIMELFRNRCLNKRIALWGAGRSNSLTSHASVIIKKYATCLQGLRCIIDSCEELQGKDFMGFPVISPKDIDQYDIDIVIISSRSSASSIKKSLYAVAPSCEYIDIYDELRKNGITILYNFYEEKSMYDELYNLRIRYEEAKDYASKAKALHELVAAYLSIKDLYYAFKYIDEYCESKLLDYEQVSMMKKELLELCNEITSKNSSKTEDVIVHFIDCLRGMDLYNQQTGEFGYLKAYTQDSLYFANAHSTAPTTYESMQSIISEKYPFERNAYDNNFIFSFEEFPLLVEAQKRKMDIQFYISEEYPIMKEDKRIRMVNQIHMSEKLWTVATDLAASDVPTFNFIYYPWELHFPLACGYHSKKPVYMGFVDVGIKDMSGFIEQQFRDCLCYVDNEFTFYKKLLGDGVTSAFFSDHSQIVYDKEKLQPFYLYYNNPERVTHCSFFIKSKNIRPEVKDGLVSMIDFNRIMRQVIFEKNTNIKYADVIRYQYYSIHNKILREAGILNGKEDYVNGMNCFMNDKYVYMCTASGMEEVYRLGDHHDNILNSEEGREFANYIKNNYEIEFPDFLKVHF
jgi:hypothetical protein